MKGSLQLAINISSPYGAARRVRAIVIDGLEIRRTSSATLRLAGVKDGDVLPADELNDLLDASEPEAAMNRALHLLGHRERSRAELETRLNEDGYPAAVAAEVLDRLVGYEYLDDERFANDFAGSKRAAGWGRRRIERALLEKGVDPETVVTVLDVHVPVEGEEHRAATLISQLDLSAPAACGKALRKLVSRGFSYDAARTAVHHQTEASKSRGHECDS